MIIIMNIIIIIIVYVVVNAQTYSQNNFKMIESF